MYAYMFIYIGRNLLCTDLEVGANGLLTGKPKGPLCLDTTKRHLATELAQRTGIDLERSYAYGNHQADLPLLRYLYTQSCGVASVSRSVLAAQIKSLSESPLIECVV